MNENPAVIRILSVDDHPLLRKGITALVNGEPDMKLVVEAANGYGAIEAFRLHRPDVTLMDLQMLGLSGTGAIERIRSEFPDGRIIAMTTYTGDVQVKCPQSGRSRLHFERPCAQRIAADHPSGACRTEANPSRCRCAAGRACSRWRANRA